MLCRWRVEDYRWGYLKKCIIEEHVLELQPSFTLIATSDGVLDVLPKGSANDKEKFLQAAAVNVRNVNDLINELNLSEEAALPDDVALLVINRV